MKTILFVIFTAIMLYAFWVPSFIEGLMIVGGAYLSASFIAGLSRVRLSRFTQNKSSEKE